MTMKRSEKREALASLAPEADGYTKVQFGSPKLRAQAKADRGHVRMTPAEVAEHRLGRKSKSAETARHDFAEQSRYPRKTTRK